VKILVALGAVFLAACGPAAAPPTPAAAPALEAPSPVHLLAVPIPVPPVVTGTYPASCHAVGKLPDPRCTPGSVNPAVTQATIGSTICKVGWTATVRPPASNTGPVKKISMRSYGEAASSSGTTEFDHLVPIEAGGSDDVTNLWPEPSDLPGHGFNNSKDHLENLIKSAVCAGKVSLAAAQLAIATNWTTAQAKLGV
jgi:hypothetical protein